MYGPQGRGRVLLMTFSVLFVFSGVLALPLLVDPPLIRVGAGDGDAGGLRTQAGGSAPDAERSVPVDLPPILVTSPATSDTATFRVEWDSIGPDPGAVYAFHVRYTVVDPESDEDAEWADWFRLRRSDGAREARFTGEPGHTYAFQGRACDLSFTCDAWSTVSQTVLPEEAQTAEVHVHLVPMAPLDNETLDGKVALSWGYDHRGPGDALVEVAVLPQDGGAEVPLYSGQGLSVVWETTRHEDGDHRLRFRLSDGVHQVDEEVPVRVHNDGGDDAGPDADEADPPAAEDDGTDAHEEAPAAPGLVLVLAAVALASVGRRR